MTQRDKPVIFKGKITGKWHWECPGGGNCTAETYRCLGSSEHFEIMVAEVHDHCREYHRPALLGHDPSTPPNGQPKIQWMEDGRYRKNPASTIIEIYHPGRFIGLPKGDE